MGTALLTHASILRSSTESSESSTAAILAIARGGPAESRSSPLLARSEPSEQLASITRSCVASTLSAASASRCSRRSSARFASRSRLRKARWM
jgi:hypothetical protein